MNRQVAYFFCMTIIQHGNNSRYLSHEKHTLTKCPDALKEKVDNSYSVKTDSVDIS